MVIKQIRNAVQRELTYSYIPDQCPLLGLVHRLVLGHLHGNFQVKLHLQGTKIPHIRLYLRVDFRKDE